MSRGLSAPEAVPSAAATAGSRRRPVPGRDPGHLPPPVTTGTTPRGLFPRSWTHDGSGALQGGPILPASRENAPRSLATDGAAAWDTVQHSRGHRRRPRRHRLRAAQVHHQLSQRAHCGPGSAARVGITVGSLGQGLPDCVGIALAAGTSTGATPRGTCPLGPDLYAQPASNLTASCSTTCSSTRLGTFRRTSLRKLVELRDSGP